MSIANTTDEMDNELRKFLPMIKGVLLRAHMFASTPHSTTAAAARMRSTSAAPAPIAAQDSAKQKQAVETVQTLERLRDIAEQLLALTVGDLLREGVSKEVIREVQELYKHRDSKDYVTKLLFIFSPTSRLVEYHHHEAQLRKKPSLLKGKSMPHLLLKTSAGGGLARTASTDSHQSDDDLLVSGSVRVAPIFFLL